MLMRTTKVETLYIIEWHKSSGREDVVCSNIVKKETKINMGEKYKNYQKLSPLKDTLTRLSLSVP